MGRNRSGPPTGAEVLASDERSRGRWWNGGIGSVVVIAGLTAAYQYRDDILRYFSNVGRPESSTNVPADAPNAADKAAPTKSLSDDTEKRHAIEQYWDAVNADFTALVLLSRTDSPNGTKANDLLAKMREDADSSLPDGVSSDVKDDLDSVAAILQKESQAGSSGSARDTAALLAQITLAKQRFEDAVEKVRTAYAAAGGDGSLIPDATDASSQ